MNKSKMAPNDLLPNAAFFDNLAQNEFGAVKLISRGFWGLLKKILMFIFSSDNHVTLKFKMAPFDLQKKPPFRIT